MESTLVTHCFNSPSNLNKDMLAQVLAPLSHCDLAHVRACNKFLYHEVPRLFPEFAKLSTLHKLILDKKYRVLLSLDEPDYPRSSWTRIATQGQCTLVAHNEGCLLLQINTKTKSPPKVLHELGTYLKHNEKWEHVILNPDLSLEAFIRQKAANLSNDWRWTHYRIVWDPNAPPPLAEEARQNKWSRFKMLALRTLHSDRDEQRFTRRIFKTHCFVLGILAFAFIVAIPGIIALSLSKSMCTKTNSDCDRLAGGWFALSITGAFLALAVGYTVYLWRHFPREQRRYLQELALEQGQP